MPVRTMPFASVLALLLAATCAAAATPDPTAELEIGVVGQLEIGPDGAVRSFEVTSKLAPVLANLVQRKVQAWTFEPIAVEGKPVIAKTRARLALRAIPHEGDYQLRIEDVSFGDAARTPDLKPPRYPRDAARAGVGAKVLLMVRLDGDGRVIEAHPYQTSLDVPFKSDAAARKWRAEFERASLAAVKEWKYDLTENIGGVSVGQTAIAPITFALVDAAAKDPNRWRQYIPGPVTPAPWPTEDHSDARTDSIADGETRSLSSRFRPTRELAGTML